MASRTPLRLSRRAAATYSEPCVFCAHNGSYGPVQKRYMAARRAPSTRLKEHQAKPHALTPERKAILEEYEKRDKDAAKNLTFTPAQKLDLFFGNAALAHQLSDEMAKFVVQFCTLRLSPEEFNRARRRSGVSLKEVYEATFALRNHGNQDQAALGRYFVVCCDAAGYPEATIQSVASALRQDIIRPGVLRGRGALAAQSRLKELCKKGDPRALVLDGKLAERKGDPDLALSLYEKAADRSMALHGKDDPHSTEKTVKYLDEFSTPWMELGILQLKKGNRKKAEEAYKMGIAQDDPMAHNMLARVDHQLSGGKYTLDWLYHVTRAAASGHYQAAYALGEYYANTKAPPAPPSTSATLEGEDVKDPGTDGSSKPDLSDTPSKPTGSILTRLHHFFTTAFLKPIIETDSRANIAHYAAAVQDPAARLKLAYEWFDASKGQSYLPSYLHMARLRFRNDVLPENNLVEPVIADADLDVREPAQDDKVRVKNPLYNRERGYVLLQTVFEAYEVITDARRKANLGADFRELASRWADFPDVLEDYEDKLDDILDEAKSIADAVKVDINHERFGLLYKHQPLEQQATELD